MPLIDCLVDATADQIMQQSGATALSFAWHFDRKIYKFKGIGAKNFLIKVGLSEI